MACSTTRGEDSKEDEDEDAELVLDVIFESLSDAETILIVAATGDTKRLDEGEAIADEAVVGVFKLTGVVTFVFAGEDLDGEPDKLAVPGPEAFFGSGEREAFIAAGEAAFFKGDANCACFNVSSEAAGLTLTEDPDPVSVVVEEVAVVVAAAAALVAKDWISRLRS